MRTLAATIMLLGLIGCASPGPPPGPPSRPGEHTTGWSEDQKLRPGKILFVRNNTDQPRVITSITLYDCQNIRGGCYQRDPKITLGPHEWRRVASVSPMNSSRYFYFRWRYGSTGVRAGAQEEAEFRESAPEARPDFSSYGSEASTFEVGPDERYGLTGRYRGQIARAGDTLIVRVEAGTIRNRLPPDRATFKLRGISLGLRPRVGNEFGQTVASGAPTPVRIDLAPGEEVEVGPFELRVAFDRVGSYGCQLYFTHEILAEDGRRASTYTFFPGTVADLFGNLLFTPFPP